MSNFKPFEYALYRGDEFLDVGTIRQLSKKLGIKENTMRYLASNKHYERVTGGKSSTCGSLIAFKLDESEE